MWKAKQPQVGFYCHIYKHTHTHIILFVAYWRGILKNLWGFYVVNNYWFVIVRWHSTKKIIDNRGSTSNCSRCISKLISSSPNIAWDFFFMRDANRKSFAQRSKSPMEYSKTEVAESPIPSHTDVVADHAQCTNCILFNVGIGTCLDVTT